MSDHDPFNEPESAHEKARELMVQEFFWDCLDEDAPFGSDEGAEAYYEWRDWREDNPESSLRDCMNWILDGRYEEYNKKFLTDERINNDIANPDSAFLSEHYDIFTLDTTIIATALGQLMDEGKIDKSVKQCVMVAINRQKHEKICDNKVRLAMLNEIERVVEIAFI